MVWSSQHHTQTWCAWQTLWQVTVHTKLPLHHVFNISHLTCHHRLAYMLSVLLVPKIVTGMESVANLEHASAFISCVDVG